MRLIWGSPKLLLPLGVMLIALVGSLGGCSRRAAVTAPDPAVLGEVAAADEAAELVGDSGFRSTPINPVRTARLVTQAAGSQVNLRSQPTTQSTAQGYGLGGDAITLLHLTEGEGGLSWYYVNFPGSGAEGWVRGDFVDTSEQAAVPVLAPGTDPGVSTGPCGDANRPEAFFETKSFTIHLCQTPQGLSYIGSSKDSTDVLTTADVSLSQGTYIAINGSYQYHVNDKALAVYRVSNGSYTQIEGEEVIRYEKFLY